MTNHYKGKLQYIACEIQNEAGEIFAITQFGAGNTIDERLANAAELVKRWNNFEALKGMVNELAKCGGFTCSGLVVESRTAPKGTVLLKARALLKSLED